MSKGWFYLSFADGPEFRGGCYVEAGDIIEAIRVSIDRGCNGGPGTEVSGFPLKAGDAPAEEFQYRLLTKSEVDAS